MKSALRISRTLASLAGAITVAVMLVDPAGAVPVQFGTNHYEFVSGVGI
jgi:hypothetical protein